MTPMWYQCIFICFIYVMCFITRPSDLSILDFIFQFFKYLSRQYSNDGSLKDAMYEDDNIIISDSTLRSLFPPQLKTNVRTIQGHVWL